MEVLKYKDPSNVDEIIESLKNAETHKDVVNIINTTFPDWILGWPKRYCIDYPSLKNNWEFICKESNTKPLSVIIVDHLEFKSQDHKLLKVFAEILTVFGHSVRRKEEFIECKYCGDAIPNKNVWKQFKDRKIQCPGFWSLKCQGC